MKPIKKVKCEICGEEVHIIEGHLLSAHAMSLAEYQEEYPKAETLSSVAKKRLDSIRGSAMGKMVKGDIKKLFGIDVFDGMKEIPMFAEPHPTTPLIDPDYSFDKEILMSVLYSIMNPDNPILLQGPTGSGKSSVITQVAARLNYPFFRINCDMDVTRADFVGQWVLEGKNMRFMYGILPTAMRNNAILVVDEWDTANPGAAMLLQAVLEDGGKLAIAETGETISPSKPFRIFCTANTLGMGDESGLYNGTQPQNFAQLDRFKLVEHVDYPNAASEKRILTKKTGITDKSILTKMVEYARLIREAFVKEEIRVTMSTRTLINIAQKLVDFGDVKSAYGKAYINKCSGADRKFAQEVLQRVWAV